MNSLENLHLSLGESREVTDGLGKKLESTLISATPAFGWYPENTLNSIAIHCLNTIFTEPARKEQTSVTVKMTVPQVPKRMPFNLLSSELCILEALIPRVPHNCHGSPALGGSVNQIQVFPECHP